MSAQQETIVISVGGSLIVPDQIDTDFLKNFKQFIQTGIAEGKRFVIITGGGKLSRRYQEAASEVTELSTEDIDWLGIHSTRLNAHLLRAVFVEEAHPVIITNPIDDEIPVETSLIVAAGFKPGASTDLRAIDLAERLGATRVINLSNIDYAYTKDPNQFPDAEKIETITWSDFRKLLPKEWDPGLNAPFDPIASARAEKLNIEVTIINGNKLEECKKYIDGQPFIGTRITSQ